MERKGPERQTDGPPSRSFFPMFPLIRNYSWGTGNLFLGLVYFLVKIICIGIPGV